MSNKNVLHFAIKLIRRRCCRRFEEFASGVRVWVFILETRVVFCFIPTSLRIWIFPMKVLSSPIPSGGFKIYVNVLSTKRPSLSQLFPIKQLGVAGLVASSYTIIHYNNYCYYNTSARNIDRVLLLYIVFVWRSYTIEKIFFFFFYLASTYWSVFKSSKKKKKCTQLKTRTKYLSKWKKK